MVRARRFALLAVLLGLGIGCGSSSDSGLDDQGAIANSTPNGSGGTFAPDTHPSSGSDPAGSSCAATSESVEKAKADIIFVIDNSGSMTEEMNQIRANVNSFASKIGQSGIDYRVIFLVAKATDPNEGGNVICVPPPLGAASCADNPPLFRHVPQSVASTNSLELILKTYDTTKANLEWKSQLRPEAWKIFVEVTDDQSAMKAENFDAQLLAKQPAGMFGTAAARRYVFHSIVGWQEGTTPLSSDTCSTAENPGTEYQKLSQLTGGIIDSVCKTDYSGVLDKLATGITARLACELSVPTAAAADPTTLVVQYTPTSSPARHLTQVTDASKCATVSDAWYYDDNTKPTRILLCPSTCEAANADPGGKLDALVGCKAPAPR